MKSFFQENHAIHHAFCKQGWTQNNKDQSTVDPPQTVTGFIPFILEPAHDIDTINTVILRCKHIAETLGQKYVIPTLHEALYYKAMQLKWATKEYQEFIIPRLRGLHTAMIFMKAIGQHFKSTGLLEVWIDSDLFSQKTAVNYLAAKDYEKVIRSHKIPFPNHPSIPTV